MKAGQGWARSSSVDQVLHIVDNMLRRFVHAPIDLDVDVGAGASYTSAVHDVQLALAHVTRATRMTVVKGA